MHTCVMCMTQQCLVRVSGTKIYEKNGAKKNGAEKNGAEKTSVCARVHAPVHRA